MDLSLFAQVVKRFWVLMTVGLVLAAGLASLSYFKVDSHGHLSYRGQEVWQGQARLLVVARYNNSAVVPGPNTVAEAEVYSALVSSDPVTELAFERYRSSGGHFSAGGARQPLHIVAQAAYNGQSQTTLPIIIVTATAATRRDAALLANAAATALSHYVVSQQQQTGVAATQQVATQWLNKAIPQATIVASPRSKTRPILVFVLVVAATLGLILVLENVRPRLREVSPEPVQIVGRRESNASSSSS